MKIDVEKGDFARNFHVKMRNRGPKSLRDSELGFWGCAKRGLRKQEQPPPPYARARLSAFYDAEYVKNADGIPRCSKCGGIIKPDVVLYEEGLDERILTASIRAISEADVLIIGGTSLVVYPAAGLIDYFSGRCLVLINKGATGRETRADLVIRDPIGEVFSRITV